MTELILLTDYRGALRQRQQIWQSLDTGRIRELLEAGGLSVRELRFEDVAQGAAPPPGSLIHYTSTQDTGYRGYVDDLLYELSRDCELVPRYEIFRAHEDKVYQELLRRRLGIPGPAMRAFGNLQGALPRLAEKDFPLVLKSARGFQSTGVRLVRSLDELKSVVARLNRPAGHRKYRLKEFLKRNVFRNRYHAEMYRDCPFSGAYILQEFLPGADGDWKVLVFDDRLYCLRRLVRAGDFRASGSGRFSFATPPDGVLDLAEDVYRRLDVPMVSLDILEQDGRCHLIEFQAMHFGTYTVDMAPGAHRRGPLGWRFTPGARPVEDEYARSLLAHIARTQDKRGPRSP